MRRFMISMLVVIAVLAFASAALAKKPDNPGKPTTTTTTMPESPVLEACEQTDSATVVTDGLMELTITGSAQTTFECLWTPDDAVGTTVATVTVTDIDGAVRSVPTVFVRDDSPGDICLLTTADGFEWEVASGETGPTYSATFDLAYDSVPAGYEDWLGHTYWDFTHDADDPDNPDSPPGTHWCAPQDTILDSVRADTNGTPLHFMVSFNARSGGSVTVELTP